MNEPSTRVLYATLKDLDIIPEVSQTYGQDTIRELSKFRTGHDTWKTFTVNKNENGIRDERDVFKPHGLQK